MGIAETFAGRGHERVERRLELALQGGTDDCVGRAYGALSFGAVRRRDWSAADTWLDEGIRYTTDRDLDARRLYLLGWRGGRRSSAAAGIRPPRTPKPSYAIRKRGSARIWALLALGAVRARRGDPEVGPLWTRLPSSRVARARRSTSRCESSGRRRPSWRATGRGRWRRRES